MRRSRLLAIATIVGCNQVAGIHDPVDDGVPAISGTYLLSSDMRTNTVLDTVVMFSADLLYDRTDGTAALALQPLVATTHDPTGGISTFDLDVVVASDHLSFGGTMQTVIIPAPADEHAVEFSITGSISGVIKDETTFCGVINGTYSIVAPPSTASLPSVAFGAVKNGSPTTPVVVDCNGDTYVPN